MDKYERQKYATDRKVERERIHDPLIAVAPKRRKGSEIGNVTNAVLTLHELLNTYDLAEEPASFAGICETAYDAAVARLGELIKPAAE